ncbi:O-antigen ligase-like membrane protein [Maritalea mobilis]|uniref:O-antigen ligase-like membrane protein n=1 Tax=Maritalea mobilis TaxID=483324 RepID=A0A4R6VQC1_9HYPH|nr:O-antigen ligase family protein [Maritalea mobilis]TDQ66152.1 O-antigen ligase-like membrane protein [Maritalea mobilis]
MSVTSPTSIDTTDRGVPLLAHAAMRFLVPVWIGSGFFVLFEPAPYELLFFAVFALAMVGGMKMHWRTNNLLLAILCFIPPAYIAVTQIKYGTLMEALIFTTVTLFLMLTGYFIANYISESPWRRMRTINKAYLFAAMLSAIIGITAYLGVLPGGDVFLRFGRAKAMFNDPNVYGPFLMLPTAYVFQRILLGKPKDMLVNCIFFLILFVGIFVSFSRGAWGHLVATAGLVFLLNFMLEATAREKMRMIVLAILGTVGLFVALLGLLSIPEVQELFVQRFALVQSYDGGETGRFGRQAWGYALALQTPLGTGPSQFSSMRITEEPHNTYLKVFLDYGWFGGMAFVWMILMTLNRGIRCMAIPSPNRLLLIPALASFVPMSIEAAIIDVDHWRHYFLIMGIIWGITAGYDKVPPPRAERYLP